MHTALSNLRNSNVERRYRELQKVYYSGDSQAVASQIRFCSPSTSLKVSDADRGEVVSVKLSESAAVKTVRFEGGMVEDFLRFFSGILQILENKKLYELATDEDELHEQKSAEALALSEKPEKTGKELSKAEKKTLKSLIEEAKEHAKKEKEYLDEVVNTIKVRLSDLLGVDFDESYQTYLMENERLEEGGKWVIKNVPRGHDTLTYIKFVIDRFFVDKAGFPDNTAEKLRSYIQQLAYSNRIEIQHFFERVEALNEMLAYTPTRKDKKGALEVTPRGNVPFTDDELMVMAIENFLPHELWDHLLHEKGEDYYPTSYTVLKQDLKQVMQSYIHGSCKWNSRFPARTSRLQKPEQVSQQVNPSPTTRRARRKCGTRISYLASAACSLPIRRAEHIATLQRDVRPSRLTSTSKLYVAQMVINPVSRPTEMTVATAAPANTGREEMVRNTAPIRTEATTLASS